MVRTKTDSSNVRVGQKASFKYPTSSPGSSSGGVSKKSGSSGNRVCPRQTPAWQKEITKFFTAAGGSADTAEGPSDSSSTTSRTRNETPF